ncbi:MAG: hypothetical protein KGZ61_06575 [Sandarakinorhabdus sp.]|nr:hypothetical protein [Sandarakinorhabdus sp.]
MQRAASVGAPPALKPVKFTDIFRAINLFAATGSACKKTKAGRLRPAFVAFNQ